MTLVASGSAAAFLQPVVQWDRTTALQVVGVVPNVGLPTPFSLTLTETEPLYSNSPHSTVLTVTVSPPIPFYRTVETHAARLIVVQPNGTVPEDWAEVFDPNENKPYVLDLTQLLDGRTLDTLLGTVVEDAQGESGGIFVDTGAHRPAVDRANNLVEVWIGADPTVQSFDNYGTSTRIFIGVVVTTAVVGANPAQTFKRYGALKVKQPV